MKSKIEWKKRNLNGTLFIEVDNLIISPGCYKEIPIKLKYNREHNILHIYNNYLSRSGIITIINNESEKSILLTNVNKSKHFVITSQSQDEIDSSNYFSFKENKFISKEHAGMYESNPLKDECIIYRSESPIADFYECCL
jgi:hypothetical protein